MAVYQHKAPPVKSRWMTEERLDKFISTVYFSDVNLQSRLLGKKLQPSELSWYKANGRFEFETAQTAEYKPCKVGVTFGPIWSTHWFRVKFEVPESFISTLTDDEEVLFYWDSSSEATLWDEAAGCPVGAFTCSAPHGDVRDNVPVTNKLKTDSRLDFLVEVTCNKLLGEGQSMDIGPPNESATYTLNRCNLTVRNKSVYKLLRDLKILLGVSKELGDSERGNVALYTANEMINIIQAGQPDAYIRCGEICDRFFTEGNGVGQHTIHAVGHCHMDCAWLWPYDETKRKCARSWSATLDLLERYPDWTFACSSAQQYEWMQTHYPALFEKISDSVKSGRFIPVGGSWVEMDGYLPSGESMCRQMLYGQRYFIDQFGVKCTEFWLPDTFGYSCQLPQIISHFGMTRFFTQKISWSLINKFPHHTFFWRGLDGTKVLSHFAPGESYHMRLEVSELTKTVSNFRDKGRSKRSLYLFGHGDGGQGPTQDMLETCLRLKDVDGLPKLQFSSPGKFFDGIEKTEAQNLCSWSGELYLEMHNGTYTTQAKIKRYNRQCESLLHNIELVCTLAYVRGLIDYPFSQLDSMWKKVLLNQFHDVLPGSAVEIANDDAKALYEEVLKNGTQLLNDNLCKLTKQEERQHVAVCNTLGWDRLEVITVPCNLVEGLVEQKTPDENEVYQLVNIPGYSLSQSGPVGFLPVTVEKLSRDGQDDVIVLSNSRVYAELDKLGRVVVLQVKKPSTNGVKRTQSQEQLSRNLVSGPGNQFTLYDDIPLYWDAWDVMDYHRETRHALTEAITEATIVENGPLRGSVEVTLRISNASTVTQKIILEAESPYLRVDCEVDWHENRKFLKVEFPLEILSDHVTYETQFGHIGRANHENTTWDSAKFEVCCQKWFDLSDYDVGVSILNDCKYGCSVMNSSTMNLSLLRAPKYPDANADMDVHQLSYAIMPHKGSFQESGVIQSAHAFNTALITVKHLPIDDNLSHSVFVSSSPSVIIDTIKVAEEDRTDKGKPGHQHVILRCYEAYGGSCQPDISVKLPNTIVSVYECDGLEVPTVECPWNETSRSFSSAFTPHKLKTFKITLQSPEN